MEEKRRALQPSAAAIEEGCIWLFDRYINALFRWDITNDKMEYILSVMDEDAYQASLFSGIFFYKNFLFLVAYCAKKNVLINLEDMSQQKVDCKRLENSYNIKTASSVQQGSKIYMFPKFWGDNIVIWDFEDKSLREVKIDYLAVGKYMKLSEDKNTWCDGKIVNNEFWLAGVHDAKLVCVRKNGTLDIYSVNTANKGFKKMGILENKFFLIPQEGVELIQFDAGTKKSRKMFETYNLFSHHCTEAYAGLTITGNILVLLPFQEEKIVMLNLNTGEKNEWCVENMKFCIGLQDERKVYILPFYGGNLFELDLAIPKIVKHPCFRPQFHNGKFFHQYWLEETSKKNRVKKIYSELVCSVDQFLGEAIEPGNFTEGKNDEEYGKRIWETVKK